MRKPARPSRTMLAGADFMDPIVTHNLASHPLQAKTRKLEAVLGARKSGSRAGVPARSVNVPLVAACGLELLRVILRLPWRLIAGAPDDLMQGGIHVPGHVLGIAAHVESRALLEPIPHLPGVIQDAMLDVNLLRLVTRPRQIKPIEQAVRSKRFHSVAIWPEM